MGMHNGENDPDDLFSHLEKDDLHPPAPLEQEVDAQPPSAQPEGKIIQGATKNGFPFYSSSAELGVDAQTVLNSVAGRHSLIWMVNAKAAGLPMESQIFGPETDLLAQFPNDISEENSLHLFAFDDDQIVFALHPAILKDALVCVGTSLSRDEFSKEVKSSIAWFLNSSSLKFQLENGSAFLHEQLFSAVSLIIVFDSKTGHWTLFGHPVKSLSWQEIGLPFSPTSR